MSEAENIQPRGLFKPGRESLNLLREEIEDLLSRFTGGEGWWSAGPPIDLSESDAAVTVKIDLPGIDPDDVDVRLSGDTLTISGQRVEQQQEQGRTYHRVERRTGSFSRSVKLPCSVDDEKVQATYRVGVLTVTLPRSDKEQPRKITIKS